LGGNTAAGSVARYFLISCMHIKKNQCEAIQFNLLELRPFLILLKIQFTYSLLLVLLGKAPKLNWTFKG